MNKQAKDYFLAAFGTEKTIDLLFEVLDALPVSVFLKNEKLEKIFANRANLELDELELNDVLGKSDFEFHSSDLATGFVAEDRAVFAEGKTRTREEYKIRKDGKRIDFLTSKSIVTTPSGDRLLVGSNTIIDALKARETQLATAMSKVAQHREDLMEIANAMPLGITLIDKNLNVVAVNAANKSFWNLPADKDYHGMPYEQMVWESHKDFPEISKAEWALNVERCVNEARIGNIAPREERGIDGSTFMFSSVLLSNGDRLTSCYDVTEQKRAQKALAKANEKAAADFADMKATLDAMKMGVIMLDRDLNIIFVNKSNYRMWNWTADDLQIGDPFRRAIDINRHKGIYDVDDSKWEEYVQNRLLELAKGDIAPREFTRKDGVTIIYSCTSLSDGKRLVSYFDITEQKEAELALREAERKAILADRAKSEFLANMSHEIRTPMNGVLGMAELLARTELDAKQKTFTEIIVKSGNALLTIINDILDFSKIDAGQLTLDPAPFRLAEAIEDVATLVSARAQEKDLELIVRIQPGLPEHLIGDVGRIRQIVTNLMGNAVKFTESGHVLVEVTGELEPSTGSVALMFKIADTGIGIPADKLKLVFEKFSQVDTSSTRRHEGTGLGLAISTKLVELMNGKMGAESEPGKGSTFWFTVTLPAHGQTARKRVLPFDVANSRVLVIDDNPVNRAILLEQMRSWTFDACAATGGLEGLAVLRQATALGLNVDVVILDYHMPHLNGADVARAIRNDSLIAGTPLILLTSVDTAMQGEEFNGVRVDAHLMKPARSSLLFDTIVSVIRDAHSAKAVDALPKPKSLMELAERMQSDPISFATVASPNTINAETEVSAQTLPSMLDILVAEDNGVNQIVFTQILESLPYSFTIVDNGRKAFEKMRESAPSMILMDVSMPDMNGLEATAAIRKHESENGLARTPIIGVTAHALKGDRERCFEAGMDDYLSKPISPDMLAAKIEMHLKPKIRKSA